MPSCSHDHENQVGQSKFPQIVPDGEYLESDELLDSSLISSPTTIDYTLVLAHFLFPLVEV